MKNFFSKLLPIQLALLIAFTPAAHALRVGGFVWPAADSTAGGLMQTNGAGTLSLTKDFDFGTASNTTRFTLPKASSATLSGLTRKQGVLAYDTDLNKAVIDTGTSLIPVGGGGGGLFDITSNLLSNSGCENNTTGWTASGGALTRDTNVANLGGNASGVCAWDPSASAQTDEETTITITANDRLSGKNGAISCAVKTAATDLKLQVFDGASVISPDASTDVVPASPDYVRYTRNFIFPASGTATPRFISQSNSAIAYYKDCYFGVAEGFNLTQATGLAGGPWVQYAPTIQGYNSIVASSIWYRQVGDGYQIRGTFDAGTANASEIRVALPNGAVTAANITTAGEFAGSGTRSAAPGLDMHVLIKPSVSYFNFSADDPSLGGLTPIVGVNTGAATISFFTGTIPIAGLAAQVNGLNYLTDAPSGPTMQIFRTGGSFGNYALPQNPRPSYIRVRMVGGGGGGSGQGNSGHGAAGSNTTFGSDLVANGGDGGGDLGGAPAVGGTASLGSITSGIALHGAGAGSGGPNNSTGITAGWAGGNGGASFFGGAGSGGEINAGGGHPGEANTGSGGGGGASNFGGTTWGGSGGAAGGYVEAIISNPANTYSFNVGDKGLGGGSSGAGGDGGTGLIEVTEYYGNGQVPAFIGSVTSTTTGQEHIERVRLSGVCTGGTCALLDNTPGISAVTFVSTGVYLVTFSAGTFSGAPTCVPGESQGTNQTVSTNNATASQVNVDTILASNNSFANGQFGLICMGPR